MAKEFNAREYPRLLDRPRKEDNRTNEEVYREAMQYLLVSRESDPQNVLYSAFLARVNKKVVDSEDAKYVARARIDKKANLYLEINRFLFDRFTLPQQADIIKHEIIHFLHAHLLRMSRLNVNNKFTHEFLNICVDLAANSFLYGPNWKDEDFNLILFPEHFDVERNLSCEEYIALLEKRAQENAGMEGLNIYNSQMSMPGNSGSSSSNNSAQGKEDDEKSEDKEGSKNSNGQNQDGQGNSSSKQSGGEKKRGKGQKGRSSGAHGEPSLPMPDHLKDAFSRIQGSHDYAIDDYDKLSDERKDMFSDKLAEQIRAAIEDAKNNDFYRENGIGTIPAGVLEYLDSIEKSKLLNWNQLLKTFIVQTSNAKGRFIRKKTQKRQGRRGPDSSGSRRKKGAKIVFAVDTSGSMSDDQLKEEVFSQIRWIYGYMGYQNLYYICVDADAYSFLPYKGQKEIVIEGRGGTCFKPLFDKLSDEEYLGEIEGLIIFTDGGIFDLSECTFSCPSSQAPKVLWILTSENFDENFSPPVGRVAVIGGKEIIQNKK